ncbi:MiaB/RimO family radical SAM methylthiotransferase [Candidatus Parcubacteria bacterium]|nr:MiaB/RimO family radical SAM methylthiotransferase [Candidatus Parcubacteria bacterium]
MVKYFIKTFGCKFNKADAEKIAKVLEKKGYKLSPTLYGADLVIILMCSVRQKSVEKVKSQVADLKKIKRRVILKGCILPSDKKMFEGLGVRFSFKGLSQSQIEKEKPKTGLVQIGQGCDNFCSYCVVPYTRGREKYRSPLEIIKEVKYLLKNGVKDITLIAQNVNSYKYGKAKPIDFKGLLEMVNNLKGNFRVGFLTNHPKDMTDELIKTIARLDKVKKEIHLPLQSGSSKILKRMNRHYTKQGYLKLIQKIRKEMPQVRLTTDIIVGFPGETKKDFEDTIDVIKKAHFKQAFIAKYSPREGTASFKLKDNVPLEEKKRREQTLLKILNSKSETLNKFK